MIRPFQPGDTDDCLAIFDGNVPHYFAPHERTDFSAYLLDPARPSDYQVLVRAGQIVACGGLAVDTPGTAAFCWGMVHRACHRQGLGTQLAVARIARARTLGAQRLVLSTSQHTRRFYAALGFAVIAITPDGHGPGLDAVEMALALAPH
ncbi:GNAT family N-acetyltransferase [Stenotrophomonas sp.]|uniref:GNAT family N-acetyltransferase n=1 Tax=Stenotrophomonas sp. TaxID=69392 RepID=UPI002FCB1F14